MKNLVVCLSVLEPTECHVGQNCLVFYLVGVDHEPSKSHATKLVNTI